MLKTLTPITLAAALALAAPVAAQDSEAEVQTGQTEAETAEKPADATIDQQLDFGEPVEGESQLGQRYSKEKHGDWDLACVKTDAETDPCTLLQYLKDQNGNSMAEYSLFRLEQEGSQAVAVATLIVPLEVYLPKGILISVDGAASKRYGFRHCAPIGCIAQIALTDSDVKAFKSGKEATIAVTPEPYPNRTVNMTLSLSGFTAGYNVVDVVKQ